MNIAHLLVAAALGMALAFALRPTPMDRWLFLPFTLAPVYFGAVAMGGVLAGILFGRAKAALFVCFAVLFGFSAIAIVIVWGG